MKNKKIYTEKITIIEVSEFNDWEWCFQFNEDEPVVAFKPINGTKELKLIIGNNNKSDITFSNNGNKFKIFAREIVKQQDNGMEINN